MKRNTLNFWIDALMFLVFLAKIWTGLLIHYILPAGEGRGHLLLLWGMNRHGYGVIHFYLGWAFIALIIVHLWLHWSWVCSTFGRLIGLTQLKPSKYSLYGIGILLILSLFMVLSLFLVKSQVKYAESRELGYYASELVEDEKFHSITGQTTLAEAARIGGVDVEELIHKLNLPDDVNRDERLGRLKRRYGFEIREVRRIVFEDSKAEGEFLPLGK